MIKLSFTIDNTQEDIRALRDHLNVLLYQEITTVPNSVPIQLERLWHRIGDEARLFLAVCAQTQLKHPDNPFTLSQIGATLGQEVNVLRSRKMTLGRTEKVVGLNLFRSEYDNAQQMTFYWMDTEICNHIGELADP